MGRWSRHPMGSDGALDAKDTFFSEIDEMISEGKYGDNYEYYFDLDYSVIKNYLESLSLDDLIYISDVEDLYKNKFVIPYIFKEYGVKIKNEEIREFLIDCFNYTDDITGCWNYCSETDENGEILELKHIRIFKENFDDVMNGKFDLPDDPGLLSALEGATGLINKF